MNLRSVLILTVIVVASGCISAETDVHVTDEPKIEMIEVHTSIDAENLSEAQESNFSSESLEDKIEGYNPEAFNFSDYEVQPIKSDGKIGADVTYKDISLTEESSVSLYKENGEVVYKDPEQELASPWPESEGLESGLGTSSYGSDSGLESGLNTSTDTDFDTDYGPYCMGATGFFTEDVQVSDYEVSQGDLVLGIENSGSESVYVNSLSIGGENVQVGEELDLLETTSVSLKEMSPEEMDECQTYDIEIDYTKDGEEMTASGSLEMEYGLDITSQTGFSTKESETVPIQATSDSLDDGSDFGSTNSGSDLGFESQFQNSMIEMMEESVNITYTVHMPGEIVNTTGEEIGDNRVKYDTEAMLKEKEIYVRSKSDGGIMESITSFFEGLF